MGMGRLVSLLVIGLALPGPFGFAGEPSSKPNILFLLTDDQRWDALGCAGNPNIHTPNMDALARDGVRFRNDVITGVGGKQVLVEDPAGNPIELFQPTLPEARL